MPGDDELAILVMESGVRHELAASAYAQRRATCTAVADLLGVERLASATAARLERADLSREQRRRAEHVVAEQQRTRAAVAALEARDLASLGRLLLEGHASLRDLYEVSCPELDTLVAAAAECRADGVFGARMTGGGFGGCCIALCRPEALESVSGHVARRFAERHGAPPVTYPVRASAGARALQLD